MKLFRISRIRIACTLLLILSKSKRASAWGFVQDAIDTVIDEVSDAANTLAETAETVAKTVTSALSISGESIQYIVGEAAVATEDFAESGVSNIVHVVNEGISVVERVGDFTSELVEEAIEEIQNLVECLGDVAEEYLEEEYGVTADFDLINLKIKLTCNLDDSEITSRNLRQGEQDKPHHITKPNGIQLTVYPSPIFELNDDIGENDIVSDGIKFENSSINDDHILGILDNSKEFSTGCGTNAYCAGGLAAKVGSVITLKPNLEMEFDGLQKKITFDGDFTATVSTGISIVAGGGCSYEKEVFFPSAPKILVVVCYYAMCVALLGQGKIVMGIQGSFLAGARAISGIEFQIAGSATIDLDDPDDLNANFEVYDPVSGWQIDAYGEMMVGITLEGGVIISTWVTPGIVQNAYPYVKLETTLFGSMSYEYGEGTVPEATLSAFSFPDAVCSSSTPSSKTTYTKKQINGEVYTSKSTTTTGNKNFYVKNDFDATDTCVALGQSLRAGIEISAGALPKGMQDAIGSQAIMESIKGDFCPAFIQSMFPGIVQTLYEMAGCVGNSFGVDIPDLDDISNEMEAVCEEVLEIIITIATTADPGGLDIPLTFPDGKQCFDIFKVGAGPDSCMSSVGCDQLPQTTTLEYPTVDMEQDNFDSAGYTGFHSTFTRIASYDGKKAFICGVSSYHEDDYEDRRFKFKYCRPAGAGSSLTNAQWLSTTEYNGKWARECSGNRFLSYVKSWYDDTTLDRRFTFKCAEFDGYRKGALCGWTNDGDYINAWDEPFTAECGEGQALTGVMSEHSNDAQDRKYSFKCCPFKKIGATNKSQWTDFANDWDGEFAVEAYMDDGQRGAISGISSYHDNDKEDRLYKFRYSFPTGCSGYWNHKYLSWTDWDETFTRTCGTNAYIVYAKGVHDDYYEDRRFKFLCGKFSDVTWNDCTWTEDWVNAWDGGFTFDCDEDYALAGVTSTHDDGYEDRRFKFYCCLMDRKIT